MIAYTEPEIKSDEPPTAESTATLTHLTDRHLSDLRASGLSDAQIIACRFHSLRAPASVQRVLGWRHYDGSLGDCLAIPFSDATGKPTGYARLKPDFARQNKDGKPIKYESPIKSTNRAFFPPGTIAAIANPAATLLLTEGEKKASKADQEGIPCIGLSGVYGWQRRREKNSEGKPIGERELIDDLAGITWQGRAVYICYDSDAATNPNVRKAEYHLAETLKAKGANVKIARLPQGEIEPNGKHAKAGLDDYLVAHGADAFRRLLAEAVEPTTPEKGLAPNEAPDDPHRLARRYLADHATNADGLTLRYWRDEWHRWDGSAYRVLPDAELSGELTKSAKAEMDKANLIAQKKQADDDDKKPPTVRKVTGRMVSDVANAARSIAILPSRIEAPAWIGESQAGNPTEYLACRNGLVHLPSLVSGRPYFTPSTPTFFTPTSFDFDFRLDVGPPTAWLEFLRQLWGDDAQSIAALQQWFGYCLLPDTTQQKIMMLVGPKRCGKGTIARVLTALIGKANIAGPTLSSLGANFGLQPLLGKLVAIISDARLSGKTDTAAIIERLLAISGEDAITIDRKHMPATTAKLPTRFMILTNELPRLGDSSGALTGRLILLRFTKSWYEQEDTTLTARLIAELPSILIWAIRGWQELRERGRFENPEASKQLLSEMDDLSSPIGAFVRDRCNVQPGAEIERSALFDMWKDWCAEQGRDHPGDASTFSRNLRAAISTLGDVQRRTEYGRIRVYQGICGK